MYMYKVYIRIIIIIMMAVVVVVVVVVVVPVVPVVPNGLLGGPWTKCMFLFRKMCSRPGQKQVFKSTSMQKHIF